MREIALRRPDRTEAGGTPAVVLAVVGNDFAGPPSSRRRVPGFEGGALDEAARLLGRRGYRVLATRGIGFPASFTQFMAPPAGTILIAAPTGRRPLSRWGWRCEACQRCINGCPESSIQVSGVRLAALQGISSVAAPVIGGALLQKVSGWSLGARASAGACAPVPGIGAGGCGIDTPKAILARRYFCTP